MVSRNFAEIATKLLPDKRSIFVSGDPGVTSMQDKLKEFKQYLLHDNRIKQGEYENAYGIFFRARFNGLIHSGIIQAIDVKDVENMLIEIPLRFQEENTDLLTMLKLPLSRIPPFPFFTVLDENCPSNLSRKESELYWSNFSTDTDAIRNWYIDLINYKKEIVSHEFPELEPAVPAWLQNLSVFVLYAPKSRVIATRYYSSAEGNDVVVKEIPESIEMKTEEIFSRLFSLPPVENCLFKNIMFSGTGKRVFSSWDHPYFTAVKDLRKEVKRFNEAQPSVFCDASSVSDSLIYSWTNEEINKVRYLAKKYSFLKDAFQSWMGGVQVLHRYHIDKPTQNRVSDGRIVSYYFIGPCDNVLVERMKDEEELRFDENDVKKYFPEVKDMIYSKYTSLSIYLKDKVGCNF